MKKLFMLIACLAFVGGTFAQENIPNQKKFIFGAKIGLNVSSMTGNTLFENGKAKAGVHIGLVGEYRMTKLFAIAPELLFSMQGSRAKEGNAKASLNGNYINVPLMARFYVLEALSFEVGPQFGFASSIIAKAKEDGEELAMKINSEYYNVFDFGIGIGATYNYNHKFFASARYNFGLTNVIKTSEMISGNKNGVFQLSVGYNF